MEEKSRSKIDKVPRLSSESIAKLNSENDTKTKEFNYSSRSLLSNNSLFGGSVCSDQQFSSILRIYSVRVTQQVESLTSPSKSAPSTTANTFRNLFKRTKKVNNEAKQLTIATDVNQNDTSYHSSTPTTHVSSLSPTKYLSPDRANNNNYNSFDEHANTSRTCSTKAVSVAESPHRTDLCLALPSDETPTSVHTALDTTPPVISARRGQQSNEIVKAQTDKTIYSSLFNTIYKSIKNNRNSTVFIPCLAVIILTLFGKNLIALCILSLLTLKLVYNYIYTLALGRFLVEVNE